MTMTDQALQTAAANLLIDLSDHGCQTSAQSTVSDFQTAYNAAGGSPTLAVDGLYGDISAAALQNTIDNNGSLAGQMAPAGCVGSKGGGGGGNPPVVVTPTSGSSSSAMPYVIGGVVVVGALAAYLYSRRKKRH